MFLVGWTYIQSNSIAGCCCPATAGVAPPLMPPPPAWPRPSWLGQCSRGSKAPAGHRGCQALALGGRESREGGRWGDSPVSCLGGERAGRGRWGTPVSCHTQSCKMVGARAGTGIAHQSPPLATHPGFDMKHLNMTLAVGMKSLKVDASSPASACMQHRCR